MSSDAERGAWAGEGRLPYRGDPVLTARPRWRRELYRVIFEHDTRGGKTFDILLILAILLSVAAVLLESVPEIRGRRGGALRGAEWVFTLLFTVEYVLRLLSARRVTRYVTSFYGIIDLFAILPTYVSLVLPGGQAFAVIRILRVLRVFRVLKLAQFVGSERLLIAALRASARKIVVFLIAVVTIVVVVGAVMYVVEGPSRGFTSIPVAMYWAIVTVTTVGYGDIAPQTPLGQVFAAFLMVLGYGIIAVPTGIVTVEMASARLGTGPGGSARALVGRSDPVCPRCLRTGHDPDAVHCKLCGAPLRQE